MKSELQFPPDLEQRPENLCKPNRRKKFENGLPWYLQDDCNTNEKEDNINHFPDQSMIIDSSTSIDSSKNRRNENNSPEYARSSHEYLSIESRNTYRGKRYKSFVDQNRHLFEEYTGPSFPQNELIVKSNATNFTHFLFGGLKKPDVLNLSLSLLGISFTLYALFYKLYFTKGGCEAAVLNRKKKIKKRKSRKKKTTHNEKKLVANGDVSSAIAQTREENSSECEFMSKSSSITNNQIQRETPVLTQEDEAIMIKQQPGCLKYKMGVASLDSIDLSTELEMFSPCAISLTKVANGRTMKIANLNSENCFVNTAMSIASTLSKTGLNEQDSLKIANKSLIRSYENQLNMMSFRKERNNIIDLASRFFREQQKHTDRRHQEIISAVVSEPSAKEIVEKAYNDICTYMITFICGKSLLYSLIIAWLSQYFQLLCSWIYTDYNKNMPLNYFLIKRLMYSILHSSDLCGCSEISQDITYFTFTYWFIPKNNIPTISCHAKCILHEMYYIIFNSLLHILFRKFHFPQILNHFLMLCTAASYIIRVYPLDLAISIVFINIVLVTIFYIHLRRIFFLAQQKNEKDYFMNLKTTLRRASFLMLTISLIFSVAAGVIKHTI
mmetsp:Transcript_180/g.267  ORF Transcript_180/g.267 Transcript_180/m.267 type:complete len:611 (-) Transcript_180:31-1863(-)